MYVDGKKNPVRADSVQVGDVLQGCSCGTTVQKIGKVIRTGRYTPLTIDGTVIVDGVKASSYISLQEQAVEHVELQGGAALSFLSQHYLVHSALSPFRMICLGISSNLLCQQYTNEGYPHFVSQGLKLARFVDRQSLVVQLAIAILYVIVIGPLVSIELLFGAIWAPTVLLALTLVLGVSKVCGFRVRLKLKTKELTKCP